MPEISSSSFSETDANNNNAPPNGFPEGMAFSGVNDSARAIMAAMKRFWNRIQGGYASSNVGNAYSLDYVSDLAAYVTGERYSFRANAANTGAATLNIDGLGAKAIKKMTAVGKADLAAGDIQSSQPVTVEYDSTDMVMVTPAANDVGGMPTGAVIPYAGTTAPNGWLLCAGQEVSRTTYSALDAVITTTYGAYTNGSGGAGSTHFRVPDLRGRVVAGKDDMNGSAANRITAGNSGINGATLGAAGGDERLHAHNHGITDAGHTHNGINATKFSAVGGSGGSLGTSNVADGVLNTPSAVTGISIQNTGAGTSQNVQPTLIMNFIIKT